MRSSSRHLPVGWDIAALGDVTTDCKQRVPKPSDTFTYIDIASVDRDSKTIVAPQVVRGSEAPSRARKVVRTGDTIVSMTRPNLNAVALIPRDLEGQIASTGFDVLRPLEVAPRWVFYAVRSQDFVRAMSDLVQGALYPAVRPRDVRAFETVVAPLPEQNRIADKLDSLLARVDACRERLDRVPAILQRFRQSVLAAATSGELTLKWREQHALEKWQKLRLHDVGKLSRGGSKHRPRNDQRLYGGSYPFIQTGDIARSGGRISSHTQTYSEFGLAQSKLWPAGTVCITIAANIADTAILEYPACFPDSVVGVVADPKKAVPEYVKWSIDVIREQLEAFAPATAQKNINVSVLESIEVLWPPLAEQREIVRRAEKLLRLADQIERRLASAVKSAELIVQSTIAKAFRGELVPQDPNDEPASELLASIRREREAVATQPVKKTSAKKR